MPVDLDDAPDSRVFDDDIDAVPAVQPLRSRRRTGLMLGGVALIAGCGLLSALLYLGVDDREEVLALARDVPYGQQLTSQDLVAVRVALDPAVHAVPADSLTDVIGTPVSADLHQGQLLPPAGLHTDASPANGRQLVAVPLRATQFPVRGLSSGDLVDIVSTPAAGGEAPSAPPPVIKARVVRVGEADLDGTRVVDVEVAATDGAALAARVATGNIAVVVNPVEAG